MKNEIMSLATRPFIFDSELYPLLTIAQINANEVLRNQYEVLSDAAFKELGKRSIARANLDRSNTGFYPELDTTLNQEISVEETALDIGNWSMNNVVRFISTTDLSYSAEGKYGEITLDGSTLFVEVNFDIPLEYLKVPVTMLMRENFMNETLAYPVQVILTYQEKMLQIFISDENYLNALAEMPYILVIQDMIFGVPD